MTRAAIAFLVLGWAPALEAAERIARENRRARELELAAEAERARMAEPLYFVPALVRPHRPARPLVRGQLRRITPLAYH